MSEIKISISILQDLIKVYDECLRQVKGHQYEYDNIKYVLSQVEKVNVQQDLGIIRKIQSSNYEILRSLSATKDSIGEAIKTYKEKEKSINMMISNKYRGANIDVNTYNNEFNKIEAQINLFNSKVEEDNITSSIETDDSDLINTLKAEGINVLSSGTRGGIGAVVDVKNALQSKLYIQQLPNGRWRIVGTEAQRISAGIKANGATYKVGSASFNDARLNLFLPKGSTISQYTVKYYENLRAVSNANVSKISNGSATVGPSRYMLGGVKSLGKEALVFEKNAVGGYKNLGNVGRSIGYLGVGLNTISGIQENIDNDAKDTKIAADIIADTANGLGGLVVATGCAKVGAALGSLIPIPVVGTVVGAIAGFALGYIGSKIYSSVTKDITEKASGYIEGKLDEAAAALSSAKSAVGNFFSGAAKCVFG